MSKRYEFNSEFENQEQRDWDKFLNFTLEDSVNELFTESERTYYGCIVDGISYNCTGGTSVVELKYRKESDFNFETYIEVKKYNIMMKIHNDLEVAPVYINFFGDDKCKVWILNDVKRMTFLPFAKINSNGDVAPRYLLSNKDCYIFNRNDNGNFVMVQKPQFSEKKKSKSYVKMDEIKKYLDNLFKNNE